MEDWIIRLVEWGNYWGVALLMLIETVFPPVPSEVIMTVAGVSAQRGNMNLAGTIAAGTAGAMLGNYLWYWLAIKFGEARMHLFIDKYSRWLTLDWTEVERGHALFRKTWFDHRAGGAHVADIAIAHLHSRRLVRHVASPFSLCFPPSAQRDGRLRSLWLATF